MPAGSDGPGEVLVDRDAMGKFNAGSNNSQIWQQLTHVLGDGTGNTGGIWSTPAYFNGVVYYGPAGAALKAFTVVNARLSSSPVSQTSGTFVYNKLPGRRWPRSIRRRQQVHHPHHRRRRRCHPRSPSTSPGVARILARAS